MDRVESKYPSGGGGIDLFGYLNRDSAGGGITAEASIPDQWFSKLPGQGWVFTEGWIDRGWNGRVDGGVRGGLRWRW